MTSPDMNDHPSVDELAELDEGLTPPDRTSAIRAHLAHCAQCQATTQTLADTSAALRALDPVTMPPEVAGRIDDALSALSGEQVAPGQATSTPEAPGTVVPELGAVRRRRRPPSLPATAAAAVVVLAVVAIVLGTSGHHHHSATESSGAGNLGLAPLVASPPNVNSSTFSVQSTGRTYTSANLSSLVPELVSGVAQRAAPAAPTATSHSAAGGTTPNTTDGLGVGSGTGSSGSPQKNTAGNAPESKPRSALSTYSAAVPATLRPYLSSRQALLRCAAVISDSPGAVPAAVDLGRWKGAGQRSAIPAVVLVFADPTDSSVDDVYVVSPACTPNSLLAFNKVRLAH
jgi:hypothetical protein